jgi:hypothetical protein
MNIYKFKILIVFITSALWSCGPLPQPFTKDSSGSRGDLIQNYLSPVVAVNAIHGAATPMAKLLARSVADELLKHEIIAYSGGTGSRTHVLDGWVESPNDRNLKSAPSYIEWALTDPTGKLIATFRYSFKATPMDWEYGSDQIIHEIGEGTATLLALELAGPVDTAELPVMEETGLWVWPVTGTPGDGDFSLTRAIRYELGNAGMIITKTQNDAEFVLKAQVQIDPPKSGEQKVEIDWIVSGNEGQEIGRATQKNTVPVGVFEGRWGQMAVMIAAAAANSVSDIVNIERNRRLNPTPEFPFPRLMPNKKGEKLELPLPSLISR